MLNPVVIDCLRFAMLVTGLDIMSQIVCGDRGHKPILLVCVRLDDKNFGVGIIEPASAGAVTLPGLGSGQPPQNMCTGPLKSNVTLCVG